MNEDQEIDRDIPVEDSTPPIIEQARANGWECAYYWFGKADDQGTDFFNPGIVERPDGPWLLTRASGLHPQGFQYGQNSIVAFKLDETGKQPHFGKILRWPVDNPQQHFEDPRGFYHPGLNQTFIGCCTFLWNGPGDWTGPHQCLGAFDEEWICKKMDYPLVGGNPGSMEKIIEHKNYEKNWLWFLHDNDLHLLYKADPWLVVKFGQRWSDRMKYEGPTASWPYGHIRGGTTPIRVGDYYFTFHHSSLPWKGRYRRYYAGCLAFEARPPFYPKLITYQPLLSGSQNDTWAQRKPLVVFPCGAMMRDGKWTISMGVNDMKAAWVEIPHESLLKRMQPIGTDDSVIFPTLIGENRRACGGVDAVERPAAIEGELEENTPTSNKSIEWTPTDDKPSPDQTLLQKRQANAAKARAALAVKRAKAVLSPVIKKAWDDGGLPVNGEPPLPRRKRRRKRFKRVTSEQRQQALKEYEAKKTLASP